MSAKSVKWLVDSHMLSIYPELEDVLNSKDIEYIICEYVPFSDVRYGVEIEPDQLGFVYGTVNLVNKTRHILGNTWCDQSRFDLTSYRSTFKSISWLNNGFYLTWQELVDRFADVQKMLNSDNVFVRPNSGKKVFTGFVLNSTNLEFEENATMRLTEVLPNTLVFVSKAQDIENEYRTFIYRGEVYAQSQYMRRGEKYENSQVPLHVIDFAKQVAYNNNKHIPYPYVLDISEDTKGQCKTIEINCINSSGFYAANIRNIVEMCNTFVVDEWEENYKPF